MRDPVAHLRWDRAGSPLRLGVSISEAVPPCPCIDPVRRGCYASNPDLREYATLRSLLQGRRSCLERSSDPTGNSHYGVCRCRSAVFYMPSDQARLESSGRSLWSVLALGIVLPNSRRPYVERRVSFP